MYNFNLIYFFQPAPPPPTKKIGWIIQCPSLFGWDCTFTKFKDTEDPAAKKNIHSVVCMAFPQPARLPPDHKVPLLFSPEFCVEGHANCRWKSCWDGDTEDETSIIYDVIHGKPCWDIQSLERCWDGKYVLLLFRWWLNIYSTSSSAYDVLRALLYTEWREQSTAKQIHWRQANTRCFVKKHVASNTIHRWLTNPCKNM